MKKLTVLMVLFVCSNAINAQSDDKGYPFYSATRISPKCINGYDIYDYSFDSLFHPIIDSNKSKINYDGTYNKVYFTNLSKSEYVEIYQGPDIGWGYFYSIGFTHDSVCNYCGNYLGSLSFPRFYVDSSVHLGDDIKDVYQRLNLPLLRWFTYQEVTYFYFEGVYTPYNIPAEPDHIVYYKFKNNKLFELGFGHAFTGFNPMFREK